MNDKKECRNCKWRSDEIDSVPEHSYNKYCPMFEWKEEPVRDVLLSLNPQWFEPIMDGRKTFEVRKRAPLQKHPYKVYLYCTKSGETIYRAGNKGKVKPYLMNGTVCGEFTCVSTTEYNPPWHGKTAGTCLTERELWDYMGGFYGKLYFMKIKDPIIYDKPKTLEDFGLKWVPQSWCYIGGKDNHED